MKKIQIQKIKRWANFPRYDKSSQAEYDNFMRELSTHLMSDLSRELILKIQRNMIDNFKSSMSSFAAFAEAGAVTDYMSIGVTIREQEPEFRKRIIEGHILFYVGNNFFPMDLEDKNDKCIFHLLSLVDKGSEEYKLESEPYCALINMIKYSYDIDKEFTDSIINFFKDYNASELKIKENLTIIYHMMLRYSGVKVDYLKTITTQHSNSNIQLNTSLGDLFSQDYNYYLHRYNSIKRKSGYMVIRRKILTSSFDNDILNHELAALAGRLSSSEQYSFCRYIDDNSNITYDKKLFSKYISKIILASKNSDCHYRLMKHISDQDFAFCLPVLVETLRDHHYGSQALEGRMKQIEKGNE